MDKTLETLCPIAKDCGGCSQINVPYAQQLAAKQHSIEDLFAPLCADSPGKGVFAAQQSQTGHLLIRPILGMENPQAYRTKIVSPFAPAPANRKRSLRSLARTGRGGKVALRREDILYGMYAAGTHKIIECKHCPVEAPVGRRVVAAVRQIMARYGMAPYNEDTGEGFVRHVVVRVGAQTGEVLVTLVTNGREFTGARNFCRELVRAVPEITTIVQNVNTHQTNAIFGQEEQVLYGPGFILDTLCGLSFRISSNSFYQVNAFQTQLLYETAIKFANIPASAKILDAYCGTGTIGLVAATLVPDAQVIGVDSVESAIADARQNAIHNGIENAHFVVQDAGEFMEGFAALGNKVDVVFMDPPRAGASRAFLSSLLKLAPDRVVYISCNPETQLRDVRVLMEGGYWPESIQPVDMFPHTAHVECVALMSRTDG